MAINDRRYTVILFKINQKSSRGYYFTEPAVDDYLSSKSYANRIKNGLALGTITHKPRKIKDEDIPQADVMLYNMCATHKIVRIFKEDGYLKAEIEFFDPELFDGDIKSKIMYLLGLIKSGVRLPSSAGIEAYYNPITKEGEVIYDIVGVDFTLSPDFIEGGIE